jgi:hypothetical protein
MTISGTLPVRTAGRTRPRRAGAAAPPPEALTAVLIAVGVLVAGGVYLAYLLMFNREVLETEPGAVDVFKH